MVTNNNNKNFESQCTSTPHQGLCVVHCSILDNKILDPTNRFKQASLNQNTHEIAILRDDDSIEMYDSKSLLMIDHLYLNEKVPVTQITPLSNHFLLLTKNQKLFTFTKYCRRPNAISKIYGENILALSLNDYDNTISIICENKSIYLLTSHCYDSYEINLIAKFSFHFSTGYNVCIAHNRKYIVFSCQSKIFCIDRTSGKQLGTYNIDSKKSPQNSVLSLTLNDDNIALCIDSTNQIHLISLLTSTSQLELQHEFTLNKNAVWLKKFNAFYLSDNKGNVMFLTTVENLWYKSRLISKKNWTIVSVLASKTMLYIVDEYCQISRFKMTSSSQLRSNGVFLFEKFNIFAHWPFVLVPLRNMLSIYKLESESISKLYHLEIKQKQFRFINLILIGNYIIVSYQKGIVFYDFKEDLLQKTPIDNDQDYQIDTPKFLLYDNSFLIVMNDSGNFLQLKPLSSLKIISRSNIITKRLISAHANRTKNEFITLNVDHDIEVWNIKSMIKLKTLSNFPDDSYYCFLISSDIYVLAKNNILHFDSCKNKVESIKILSSNLNGTRCLLSDFLNAHKEIFIKESNKILYLKDDTEAQSFDISTDDVMLFRHNNKIFTLNFNNYNSEYKRNQKINKYGF